MTFVCDIVLCDVSLYYGGLDRAGSRMTTLVAFIFAKVFAEILVRQLNQGFFTVYGIKDSTLCGLRTL